MAYTSLYRRYRPNTFRDVIGQDHVVRTLVNQIKSDSIGHAYLFTGTRGTGKTSVAKIFARAVNCLHPVDGSPCGECEVCRELAGATNFDILEIDAASNNSVDQIRELTDKINFSPTVGRYKVYIVDEVHMLSKSAHNALLKTLEEPPEHAVFILATTEVYAIPATILSRCLRFDFRLVPSRKIADRIKYIFGENGVGFQDGAVNLIAEAGQGSVRDALSIADMCVSYCSGEITYDGVLEVLGTSNPLKVADMADSILDGDVDAALGYLAQMCDSGKSMPALASDLAVQLRNALYIKTCANAEKILSLPAELYAALKDIAAKYTVRRMLAVLKAITATEGDFRYSTQHRILFESAVIAAATEPEQRAVSGGTGRELEQRIALLERKIQALTKSGFKQPPAAADAGQVWRSVASELERRGLQFIAYAALEADVAFDGGAFRVKVGSSSAMMILTDKNNRDALNEVFSLYCDKKLVIEEVVKLGEDKALPYLTAMFGKSLEIK